MKLIAFLFTIAIALLSCNEQMDNKTSTQTPASDTLKIPLDTLLKKELESIRVEDQTLRMLLPAVNEKFGSDSPEKVFFSQLIQQQDSICINKVSDIIDQHGWISVDRVGYFANQTLWLVIQHAPLEIQEKYLPKLRASVEKGESEGWYLAFLEDRILMYKGEKQTYGSQAKPNSKTGKTHIYPIKDVSTVNERRAEIGLETIEEHAKQNGYVFDINEHQ